MQNLIFNLIQISSFREFLFIFPYGPILKLYPALTAILNMPDWKTNIYDISIHGPFQPQLLGFREEVFHNIFYESPTLNVSFYI